ncbi:MAG TPA: hypothetical protein P5229_01695 [Candidatus Gracilibacteria bacterium]|nr:hypothetical protein [Candidatus Gracilibacteria bacterium]HRY91035.1 hypothetical protein [Candidatus Gracilibacteria bacterium]
MITDDTNQDPQKILLRHDQIQIDPGTQEMLNKPLDIAENIDKVDMDFLQMMINKIEKKELDLYKPETLINHAVYDKLDEMAQGKADYDALNLLSTIREIYRLWQSGERETYQIIYLVHKVRLTKERLEELGGDIYTI